VLASPLTLKQLDVQSKVQGGVERGRLAFEKMSGKGKVKADGSKRKLIGYQTQYNTRTKEGMGGKSKTDENKEYL